MAKLSEEIGTKAEHLADWFDVHDALNGIRGKEIQNDLRSWRSKIVELENQVKGDDDRLI